MPSGNDNAIRASLSVIRKHVGHFNLLTVLLFFSIVNFLCTF